MRKRLLISAIIGVGFLYPTIARAQSAADSAAIRATALDYIDGWYAADGPRMERSLHPELAKRNVFSDSAGRSRLIQMSAMTLVQSTRMGGGSRIPAAQRSDSVKILDIFEGTQQIQLLIVARQLLGKTSAELK